LPETRLAFYRIAQEALTSARRHAQARTTRIELDERDGGFLLRVRDDGIAPGDAELERSRRLGLAAIRERAELAGGSLRIESAPAGTTIEVWIPDAEAR
jgi:two-component system NarL family sensor kinase